MWLLLPLAYVAGAHGFALFAPYLALFLAAAHVLRRRRRRVVVQPARQGAATMPTFEM
jgi:hypothetical protein